MSIEITFNTLAREHSLEYIAEEIGLHPNTVRRWEEKGVPPKYKGDMLRLLGGEDNGEGDARANDQFYTKPEIAKDCFGYFEKTAKDLGVNLSDYTFVEPSAGCGWFYQLLPQDRRIGIDISPSSVDGVGSELLTQDFLKWQPENKGKYVVIGNPPFGLRGHTALQFINHSANFADLVGLILPPLFNSDGKGVPAKRVKGYTLAFTKNLPDNSFQYPDGKAVSVTSIFQVWTRINTDKRNVVPKATCKNFIRVYSLSDGGTPASTRNKDMLDKCDVYLPSTCYTGMKLYSSFEDLPHRRGYGVKILRNKSTIKKLFEQFDYSKIAFKSTNGAMNLRTSLIEEVVITGGYNDKQNIG